MMKSSLLRRIISVSCLLSAALISGCGGNPDFGIFHGGGGGSGGGSSGTGDISAVTVGNNLVTFNASSPGTILSSNTITGLQSGEVILAIDYRPANGLLYGLGSQSRLYTINSAAQATQVGSGLTVGLSGSNFSFDFDPTADRIRVVSDTGQNLRIDPASGAVVSTDTSIAAGHIVTGIGYDRDFDTGGTSASTASVSTLYGIDASSDSLVHVGGIDGNPSANGGTVTVVGSGLGVSVPSNNIGFDINGVTGTALATILSGSTSSLYTINLVTGVATLVAAVGGSDTLRDIAIPVPKPALAYVTTDTNFLLSFKPSTPGTTAAAVALAVPGGDTLLGIDFRPGTNSLYALGASGHVYRFNTTTGAVAQDVALIADPSDVSSPFVALSGTNFGVDFDPAADVLRVVSDAQENLRVNVDNGRVTTDTDLTPAGNIVAAAYSNNFDGVSSSATTLYAIDATTDQLLTQNPPNNGTMTSVGSLGVDTDNNVGFDIVGAGAGSSPGLGFAAMNVGSLNNFYRINLGTGAATLVDTIAIPLGDGVTITGLAIQLTPP